MKGTKYSNENIRKINQRSQSVLKSHTEFNHNFNNNQNTTGSLGSNSTQRAINNYTTAPGSKSTAKNAGAGHIQQVGMKTFNQSSGNHKHLRSKKLVNINDKMINVPSSVLNASGTMLPPQTSEGANPYIVDSFQKMSTS